MNIVLFTSRVSIDDEVVVVCQVFVLEEPINNVALSTVISFHLVVEQEVAAECIRNLSYLF